MSAADYRRYWQTTAPTALGVQLAPGRERHARASGDRARAWGAGIAKRAEVATAPVRAGEARHARERRAQPDREISTLLTIAAILALATALASAIWQRRVSLAELRLTGATPTRLRRLLLLESTLLLGAGCLTGAVRRPLRPGRDRRLPGAT